MDSKGAEWLITSIESETEQRMKAEKLLLDIMLMPWYRRLFVGMKIYRFFLVKFNQEKAEK